MFIGTHAVAVLLKEHDVLLNFISETGPDLGSLKKLNSLLKVIEPGSK